MKQTTVTLYCDPCQADGKSRKGITVTLGLDGKDYETELCPAHSRALEKIAEAIVPHARRVNGRMPARKVPGPRGGRVIRTAQSRRDSADIRAWAAQNGHQVSARGRVPAAIVAEYRSEHAQ